MNTQESPLFGYHGVKMPALGGRFLKLKSGASKLVGLLVLTKNRYGTVLLSEEMMKNAGGVVVGADLHGKNWFGFVTSSDPSDPTVKSGEVLGDGIFCNEKFKVELSGKIYRLKVVSTRAINGRVKFRRYVKFRACVEVDNSRVRRCGKKSGLGVMGLEIHYYREESRSWEHCCFERLCLKHSFRYPETSGKINANGESVELEGVDLDVNQEWVQIVLQPDG